MSKRRSKTRSLHTPSQIRQAMACKRAIELALVVKYDLVERVSNHPGAEALAEWRDRTPGRADVVRNAIGALTALDAAELRTLREGFEKYLQPELFGGVTQ